MKKQRDLECSARRFTREEEPIAAGALRIESSTFGESV